MLFFNYLKAQLEHGKFGNIIPFSKVEKYKNIIESKGIESYKIPYLNNDSLFRAYNKGKTIDEIKNDYVSGFIYNKTSFSLKNKGTKIDLENGTLWRYKIETKSAGSILVNFKCPSLKKGSYLAFIASDTSLNLIQPPEVYQNDDILERHKKIGLTGSVFGKSLIIEYYEPHSLQIGEDIVINYIIYGFVGFGKKIYSINNSTQLKSGYWGDSAYPTCQHDISCAEYSNWQNAAKSVVFLYLRYLYDIDGDGQLDLRERTGTGVFLNKAGDYSGNDTPLLLTAGHHYSLVLENGSKVDINNSLAGFGLWTAYENNDCGIDDFNQGIKLPGNFQRIAIGNNYNVLPSDPNYSASEDYAILQASSTADILSNYDIEYAAWSTNYELENTSNVGYACIHHPNGDAKKINIDDHKAYTQIGSLDFDLYYDEGLSEPGTSGAPIFNASKQVVGWANAASSLADCQYIGQVTSQNKTICGSLSDAYFDFYPILDLSLSGESTSSNPDPPIPPAHCDDCIQNYDETAIDCGGADCYPCGMQDVITLKTLMDIPENSAKSRYELFAEPDPNTLLALKSGNDYSFEAGMNVHLNGGFEVEQGAAFYAGIDAELMSEPDRGCGGYCVNTANVFTPNGDGINDYWAFSQAFAIEYDLRIWDRNNQTIYSINGQPIYKNGGVIAWDGSGATQNTTYWGLLTLTDCNGNTHQEDFFVQIFGLKSAEIPEEKIATEIKNVATTNEKIEIYPNPFSDNIIINFSGGTFPLEYKVTDLNGKVVLHNKTSSNNETVNLSGLAAGTYVINAKAGDCNLVQKIIKE